MSDQPRPPLRRFGLATLVTVVALLVASAAVRAGERVSVDKPVRVAFAKVDKSKLAGRVISYDQTSFELLKTENDRVEVKWAELDATNVYQVRSALISRPEGPGWLALGRDIRAMPGGDKLADRAFANALKADPKLKDAVDAARKEPVARPAATAPAEQDPKAPWNPLTAHDQDDAIRSLDAFAAETQRTMGLDLSRHETNFFLFYTDLPAAESKRWADLLDRMYARLSDLFATGKGVNVWRGKALVFVFAKSQDYQRFERLRHNTDARGALGMCHNFPTGEVHVAFYRQPDEKAFAHVLVHESVHGFLHRFRTPVSIPSWVNEGLAEWIACELVPGMTSEELTKSARSAVESHDKSLGGMLDAKPIAEWHYPVAESLTNYMIEKSRRGYVSFVIAIKDGAPWPDALKDKLKTDRAGLAKAYGEEALKVKGVKP